MARNTLKFRNSVGERYEAVGVLDVEVLDKLAIHQHDALAGGEGFAVCQNNAARPFDLRRRRRKHLVRGGDRLG
jgi:hypothetical protein